MSLDPTFRQRMLDEIHGYAPSLAMLQLNERATVVWQTQAQRNPTGIEACGLADMLKLRRTLRLLYWRNTLGNPA